MKLKTAMLYVKNFDAMREFYVEQLGLHANESTEAPGWVEFVEGLALHAIPGHIASKLTVTGEPLEEMPVKLIFTTEDLEAACDKIGEQRVIRRYQWGAADCVDPEGNIFQLSR